VKERRLPKKAREVQNLAPAEHQITAEQIVREAFEAQIEQRESAPKQQITTAEELADYKMRKRKEFEDNLRRNRMSVGVWMRYALWEQQQKEFERARSIYERVLGITYTNHSVWLKYAEMEMVNGFVNRARNVWDRAVQLLPRVDQLWYKYGYMEEKLKNYEGARRIFDRWMKWKPTVKAWDKYVALEWRLAGTREEKLKRCREVYKRFVNCHIELSSFLKYANWERHMGNLVEAREIYEMALQALGDDVYQPKYFLDFSDMEIEAGETARARQIFKYALDHVPKRDAQDLFKKYMAFEKQYGDRTSIDTVILNKRRFEFEEKLKDNSHNYDVWFDYIRLEMDNKEVPRIRETFERAIGCTPLSEQKRLWRRYIYIFIKYAIFEELVTKEYERVRKIFKCAIYDVIPHDTFTFGKIWILYAEFEIRQMNLQRAKLILGEAIGKTQKKNVLKRYIEILVNLKEADNARNLYQKWLELYPDDTEGWIDYATFEKKLVEFVRVRSILDLAIEQEVLDMPEKVWKFYIDFEIEMEENDRARALYERLLERTKNVRVWTSYATFECSIECTDKARDIFKRGEKYFKVDAVHESATEERVMLLEDWRDFENMFGTDETKKDIANKLPKKVKRKRPVYNQEGVEVGQEEYYDYIFPEEDAVSGNLNLLQMAMKWKMKQIEQTEDPLAL